MPARTKKKPSKERTSSRRTARKPAKRPKKSSAKPKRAKKTTRAANKAKRTGKTSTRGAKRTKTTSRTKAGATARSTSARKATRRNEKKKATARRAKPEQRDKARSKSRAPAAKKKAPKRSPAQVERERERARRARERERDKARRDKERERAQRERERERARKQREKAQQQRERERDKARRDKERDKARRDKERERERKQRERAKERAERDKQRERARGEKERERERKQREKERAQERARKEAERAAQRKAKEQERARLKAEREAAREEARRLKEEERQRIQAEREAAREEARRIKEEERARKEAEREAYRKAKEAEREKVRAEREAARRALEGRVARATRRAQRVAGVGRGTTTRVYRPDAIPNQSGTTRRIVQGLPPSRFANLRGPEGGHFPTPPVVQSGTEIQPHRAPVPQPPARPKPERIEDRYALIVKRLEGTEESFRRQYAESFDMSWIYHDSALEGVVYTFQELKTAIDPNITVVPDSSLQPVCEEIRRHKAAIDLVRELGEKKRVPINIDIIKRIYLTLHPEEGDLKSVKYRKDIPQHRLYFHEYAPPDKIAYRVRQVIDWLNGPEPKKIKNPVRISARVHYDLLRVFPFPSDSGKVARLLMNVMLLRAGYPPAIIHSTERQRYYEALKGSLPTIVSMINEAILNGIQSIEKLLDEEDAKA